MNDLAIEIKKLADKYRNSQVDRVDTRRNEPDQDVKVDNLSQDYVSDYVEDFDDGKLDLLEQEIANIDNLNDSDQGFEEGYEESDCDVESENSREIKIADFINPKVDVVQNSGYENEENLSVDRKSASESLRNVSKNLRNLKALLRS